jgi:hypothetical protein
MALPAFRGGGAVTIFIILVNINISFQHIPTDGIKTHRQKHENIIFIIGVLSEYLFKLAVTEEPLLL